MLLPFAKLRLLLCNAFVIQDKRRGGQERLHLLRGCRWTAVTDTNTQDANTTCPDPGWYLGLISWATNVKTFVILMWYHNTSSTGLNLGWYLGMILSVFWLISWYKTSSTCPYPRRYLGMILSVSWLISRYDITRPAALIRTSADILVWYQKASNRRCTHHHSLSVAWPWHKVAVVQRRLYYVHIMYSSPLLWRRCTDPVREEAPELSTIQCTNCTNLHCIFKCLLFWMIFLPSK